jgi:ferritin-like metal-binding protein YciE
LKVRDLYHREKKLARWITKFYKDLDGTDLKGVQKVVQHLRDTEKSTLWTVGA